MVKVPVPHKGDDARALAAQERAAILEANARLKNDRAFYSDVNGQFGKSGQ